MKGFFQESETSRKIALYPSPRCGSCKLCNTVQSGKMPLDGRGQRKIMVIGEAPGREEDEEGRPFVGRTGRFLENTLSNLGVDFRRDCWITNSTRCRPWEWARDGERKWKANRSPTAKEIEWCRPYLTGDGETYGDIARLQPEIIILLGNAAVQSILGWLWRDDPGGISRWVGWQIPCQKLNAWICPTWHPSYVVRGDDDEKSNEAVEMMWKDHLKRAVSLKRRPWKRVPDYASRVKVEMTPRQAAQYIDAIIDMKKPTAFDYETYPYLKPDSKESEIICCSMSNGTITVAYPWQKEAVEATRRFIRSSVPKIASNAKYEERWTRRILGHSVRNWWLCTMTVAHMLDNRPDITSIKWQAFARLGQPSWDDEIKPYMESKGQGGKNRLKELYKDDPRKLLHYCGMDSLMEYEVGMRQAEELGLETNTYGKLARRDH